MAILQANGIRLSYNSFGDTDADTVLLIAGLGTQMIRWSAIFCETLATKGYRVIRFDNRDAGGSSHFTGCPAPDFNALIDALKAGKRPDVPYTLHDMATDTVGLLDALNIKRAHLVGRSMGGMIAQVAASAYPQRVLSLTSIMSSSGNPKLPPASPEVMAMLTRRAPNPHEDEAGFLEHGLALARCIASPAYPFDAKAQRALILEESKRAHDPSGLSRQLAAIAATGDLRPLLAKISVPTLIIHGTEDALVPAACGRDTAASIEGAELMLMEGMGHDLPIPLYPVLIERIDRLARRSQLTGANP